MSGREPRGEPDGAGPMPGAPAAGPIERRRRRTLGPLPAGTSGTMAFRSGLTSAREALRANKMRSFLTALGIIIGVGAVIVMVALGEGATASVEQRLSGLGTNLLTIRSGAGGAGPVSAGAGSAQTLTVADAQAIQQQVSGIAALTPQLSTSGAQVIAGSKNWNTSVDADYPAIFTINNWSIARGAAFDQSDESAGALVCDIGQTVATNLFGTADPVGQQILVKGVPLIVKGELASKGSSGPFDQDDVILMPFSTAEVRLFNQTYVNTIYVQVSSSKQISTVQSAIETLLRARHSLTGSAKDDFQIQNNQQIVSTVTATSDTLTYLLGGVAGVSLVVGGIGIMNIMLVSVTERTREIGIRLAIGAKQRNVLTQFLIESALLSLIGGIIGIVLGVGAALLMGKVAGWSTLITWKAVLLSFGFAAATGIFFGYYPARQAARLNPIEALRHE